MGLGDIFSEGALDNKVPAPTRDLSPSETSANNVARLYDDWKAKSFVFNAERKKRIAEIEDEIYHLQASAEEAKEGYLAARDTLEELMGEGNISEIPMSDRDPIYIKVVRGTKKSVSKKWLCSEEGLGKQGGAALWGRVPKHADYKKLVIPDRFDDQPSD